MNWHKYTVDGWLMQFGAWCNTCVAKGGHLPNGLHINQIYWLMQSVKPHKHKASIRCEISDNEASEINQLLLDGMKFLHDEVELLIQNKVHHYSISELARRTGVNKSSIYNDITAAKCYLAGLRKIKP